MHSLNRQFYTFFPAEKCNYILLKLFEIIRNTILIIYQCFISYHLSSVDIYVIKFCGINYTYAEFRSKNKYVKVVHMYIYIYIFGMNNMINNFTSKNVHCKISYINSTLHASCKKYIPCSNCYCIINTYFKLYFYYLLLVTRVE